MGRRLWEALKRIRSGSAEGWPRQTAGGPTGPKRPAGPHKGQSVRSIDGGRRYSSGGMGFNSPMTLKRSFLSLLVLLAVPLLSFSGPGSPSAARVAKDIAWSPAYGAALETARDAGKVVFVAVNMDGERANDRMVKDVYCDKRIVGLTEGTVNLLASVAIHKKSGSCSRFGGLTCEQHRFVDIDVRTNLLKADASGAVVSPQHVFLSPQGDIILSVPYEMTSGELEWCFLEALSTLDPQVSPKSSRTARKPRRLIMGDVIANGGGVAKPVTREEALELIAELKKGNVGGDTNRNSMMARLITADEPEARDYVLSMLRAGGAGGGGRGGGGARNGDRRRGELMRQIGLLSPPTYWELCAEFADGGTASVMREAVVALEQLASKESLPMLTKTLRRASDPMAKKNLLRAIGSSARGDKGARKDLLKASVDKKNSLVRANALLAMGWLDADEEVKERLGEAALPATLGAKAKIKPEKVAPSERLAAVVAMGLSRQADWKELLDAIALDENEGPELREAAKSAAEVIGGAPYSQLRAALMEAGADEIPRDRLFPEVVPRRTR